MSFRKWFNLLFAALFVLSLLPGAALAQEGAAPQPAAAIESELLAELAQGPADLVIVMAEQADLSPAYEIDDWDARGWFVYNTLKQTAERSQAAVKAQLEKAGLRYESFFAGNEIYVWAGSLEVVNSLAALPEVGTIRQPRTSYVDPLVEAEAPSDEVNALAWGIDWVEADQFWANFDIQGEGVLVANIDTGVQWDHPALDQAYKCASNPTDLSCWYDPSNSCSGTVCDNNGHGTHTMGTMVGDDDPALTWQAGMAPGAQFIMCKGCESNSCSEASLLGCGDWVVAPNGDPANRPHVVNNSWGGRTGTCDLWYLTKVQAWRAAGIFPAFSAGNSGSSCNTLGVPSVYQESFATAGFDSSGNTYTSSSRGPAPSSPPTCDPHTPYTKPNIAAPAVSVCSTIPGNSWSCGYTGTSMASPHTAGAVALLWACNPSLVGQIDQTFNILQDTADPSPNAGNCGVPPDGGGDYTHGYGYLDVNNAGLLWCGDTGYLDGHVYDALTSSPIAGATVDTGSVVATTDATGYYTMTVLAGTYTVTASHPLYLALAVANVEVTADTVTTQDFTLQPRGRLWGYVTDLNSGAPLEATVTADDGTTAETDPATGLYEMYLDPGTYDVTAEATDYASVTLPVNIVSGVDTQQDFALLAAIAVVPDPIAITLELGTTGSVGSVITNNMSVDYPFEFFEVETTGIAQVKGAGGPDAFGYTFKDNLEPDGPLYNFVDISATGTSVALSDEQYQGPLPLGFPFNFYGTDYTSFYVSSNGFLSFGAGSTSLTNQNLPNTTTPNNLIALMWDDLDPGDTSDLVYYQTFSSCPYPGGTCAIIQYENYHHYPGGGTIAGTWQAILFDDGNILIQFEDVGGEAGLSSTTGIENSTGTIGLTYVYNTATLFDESAICFQYPGSPPCGGGDIPWFGPSLAAGTVPADGSLSWTDAFSATAAAGVVQPGTYEGLLIVHPTAGGLPSKQVSIVMEVTAPATYGLLDGTVTSERTGEPLEAGILIESSGGVTWPLTTDPATGYYSYWLDAGAYTVSAHVDGYSDETASVNIVAGVTTTQDFALEMDAAWIDFDHDAYEKTLEFGMTAVEPFTVTNYGPQELTWELSEIDNGMTPLAQCEEYYGGLRDSIWTGGTRDRGNFFEATEDTVISQIFAYLSFTTATDMYFIVYEGDALTGSYTQIYSEQAFVGPGAEWWASEPTSIPVEAGKFYYIGGSWNASAEYYRDASNNTPYPTNCMGILQTATGATRAGYPPAATFSNTSGPGSIADYAFGVITGGGDVPWLAEAPISGTVPAYSTFTGGEVQFDAGAVPEPGTYLAELRVTSNDPLTPRLTVPVTMHVVPAGNVGRLEGTVTGTGYCDGESYPLEAELLIVDSTGMTYTVPTDPDTGYYYRWLESGTYTVTASAPDHLPATDVAVVEDGGTTTLDLALRYIESCMDVAPDSFSVTLPVDTVYTDTLSIANNGADELLWEIRETTATLSILTPARAEGLPAGEAKTYPVITSAAECAAYENYAGHEPVGWAEFCAGEVSLPVPSGETPAVPTDIGYAQDIGYISDNFVSFQLNDFTGQTVVGTSTNAYYGMDFDPSATVLWALNDTTDMLGTIDLTTGAYTPVVSCPPGGGEANWTGLSIGTDGVFWGSTSANLYTIDPATGASTLVGPFNSGGLMIEIAINADGQMYGHDITNDSIYSIDTATGAATLIGSTGLSCNYAQGMDFDFSDGTLYIFAYIGSGANTYGTVNLATGLVTPLAVSNPQGEFEGAVAVPGAVVNPWIDVPWVSEVPTNGVTLPYETFDVDVVFDSTGLTLGECYTASLGILHDDPGWDSPYGIPLELCVVEQPPEPVFALAKEASVATALPGELVTFTITFNNTGDPVDGVSIVDTLPEGVVFIEASDGGVYDDAAGTVVWDDLTVGSEVMVLTVVVQVGAETEPGTLTNVASLTWLGEEYATDSAEFVVEEAPPPYRYYYLPIVFRN